MRSKLRASFWSSSAVFGATLLAFSTPVLSQEANSAFFDESLQYNDPLLTNRDDVDSDPMNQVTNVNQLQDVSPADWAYEALRSLVDRYGCIAGFPNQTYRGNQALSRYEFAAGLNSCLNQIERLIASSEAVVREDVDTINRLTQEFEAELATISGRIDNLEGRTAFLEDNQFSTTTKLVGEVAFTLAGAFGEEEATDFFDDDIDEESPDLDSQIVFTDKVRLQLVSSFTGRDQLITRLSAANIGNSFQDETGTREGRFAHDFGVPDNDVVIDRLHYTFGLLDGDLQVTTMAVLAGHHFYAEAFNDGLNSGGGATGGLTRFSERSPIYRQGITRSSAGLGLRYSLGEKFEISAGYIAPGASDPDEGAGLFNGTYSAMGQFVFKPYEKLKVGVSYVRGFNNDGGSTLWGGTGTNLASLGFTESTTSNTYGAQFQWDISSFLSLRGWFAYADINLLGDGDADVMTYAGALVFPDLGKQGNLGALVVGAEPYLTDIELDSGNDNFADDIPLHVEAFYKYQLNDNISVTPGVIWLASPNQNADNDDIFIGAIRTTFSF
ncbi:Carbohydrate-selective porin [Hyella patelloides LEGE 07179]|uniref:Carbohydrate-selective porin n=1 Tax=Hyella patelloides LEGE 07179 TaxID=945734 RepID=A0A563VXW2_9CYAN|nr:iron uptake porin [Hyella patelloides]VEP16294.1 Carbohydrate-selective porin [Hyella patelloides LEGE 07179]